LQVFVNASEQPRRYGPDFARRRSGVHEQYLAGELVDLEHSEEEIEKAVASIPD
jgi:hypothetical protein